MMNTSLQTPNHHIQDLSATNYPEEVSQAAAMLLPRRIFTAEWDMHTPGSEQRLRSAVRKAICEAIIGERQRIVSRLKEEADLTPCGEDAMVTRSNARLIEADFSYEEAERLAEEEEARP